MATYPTNSQFDQYTTLDIAPDRFTQLTGTINSVGIWVTGVGTLFLTDIGGDQGLGSPTIVSRDRGYIFNGSNEIRRITGILSNTRMTIDHPFTVNMAAGTALKYIVPSRWVRVEYFVDSGTPSINGKALVANERGEWGQAADSVFFVEPFIVSASGAVLNITKYSQK